MADGGAVSIYDCAAIADALGITKRAIELRAAKEYWPYTEQPVRGGRRRLFALPSLPGEVQAAVRRAAAIRAAESVTPAFEEGQRIARRLGIGTAVDTAVAKRARERGSAAAAGLTGKKRERMEAKLELLQRLAAFAKARNLGTCAAMDDFCTAYNSGELTVPIAVRMHTGAALAPRTLRRWRHLNKTQGPAALAGDYGNRAGTGALDTDPQLHDFTVGLIADKPHISAKLVFEALQARFNRPDLPKLRTVQDWLARWKRDNAEALMAVANPDQWKNRHMASFGSLSESVTRACQLWMLDSTPADLQLVDGRYSLVGVVDIAWRGFRLHVSKTSNAEAVTQVMRRAILEWGVPEAIKVDNGRDYASARVASMLAALHIDCRFSTPFAGWEKGNIERAFRTFSHSLLELLPGYTGHNVAEAQELRARQSFAERLFKKNEVIELKLTAAELQQFCDDWCQHYYAHEKHEALGGRTPFETYAGMRDVVNRIDDVRALDLLLGAGAMRRVTKKGLRIDSLVYIAPELASVIGQDVLVRQDDGDLGRVVVYHREAFLCIAECPEVAGVSRREIAIEGKARQSAAIQQKKRELKALGRKANTADLARDILDHKMRQNAALTTLPAPNVVHLTPAIEAAGEAADALEQYEAGANAPAAEPVTLEHLASLRDAMRDEQAQDETAEDRFQRALRTLMKPEAERDDIERRFLRNHLTSAEFLGRWGMFEDFGPSAFGLTDDFAALLPDGAAFDRLSRAQQGEP